MAVSSCTAPAISFWIGTCLEGRVTAFSCVPSSSNSSRVFGVRHSPWGSLCWLPFRCCTIEVSVARSIQVYIYCGSTASLSSYLRNERLIIDTERCYRQITLPILYDSAGLCLAEVYERASVRIATETRSIRNE